MNMRQRWILVLGVGVAGSVLAFGTSQARSVAAAPVVQSAPGQYSRDFTDASLPKLALLTALGLAAVTGTALYFARTMRKAL